MILYFKAVLVKYRIDLRKRIAMQHFFSEPFGYFSKGMKIGITGRIQTGSYTDKNNCEVTTVKGKPVTTKEVKLAQTLLDTIKVCTNGYETLDATATGGSGNYSYSWTGTNVSDCLDSDDSPIVEFASEEAGEYIFTCHIEDDDFGCELDTTIVVVNKQAPWIKVGDDIQPICYGGKATSQPTRRCY